VALLESHHLTYCHNSLADNNVASSVMVRDTSLSLMGLRHEHLSFEIVTCQVMTSSQCT
jgi:hypothetical protein